MSGHSKWNNIKRKKGAADAQRGKLFTKLGREIQLAVREGGKDPNSNRTLKDVIAKAKTSNMPNDSIQRSIQKAAGDGAQDTYESIVYEGYGAGGVAVMVEALTDNRNRTGGDVRHAFDKFGGNLGTNGCVAFQFNRIGQLWFLKDQISDEDKFVSEMLDAGAFDVDFDDEEVYEVKVEPDQYLDLVDVVNGLGYEITDRSLGSVPCSTINVTDPEIALQLDKMMDFLIDLDDVTNVVHNWEQD